jgi:putative tricarboxylic transport membrane protein
MRAVAILSVGLLAFLVLLEALGFVVAASVMFACVSAAFAAAPRVGRLLQTLAIALVFSTLVYMAFTRGLDLALPAGAIWSWIR